MEERLRTDLFCSLLMANRIMTGKQILKLATEEKMKSLSEFWERREELIVEERMTSDQKEKWIHFKESPAYLRIDEYVDYVNKRQIRSMNRLDDEYPEYMTHLTNMPLILSVSSEQEDHLHMADELPEISQENWQNMSW